ncbi:MAG: hypothetical protein MI922_30255 [Bacteroidales bacterium]|nr:hypothetical protein [Bacteroidales bacterium]
MKKGFIILLAITLCISCFNEQKKNSSTSIPGFVEIVNGQTNISDSMITCELELKKIAEKFKFDNKQLADNHKEYEWSVYFDNDRDGIYDISFSLSNWKFVNETERIGSILDKTQSNIWKISGKGGNNIGEVDVKIEGNKITFMMLNQLPEVKEISSDSKIKYLTEFNDGTKIFTDSLVIMN